MSCLLGTKRNPAQSVLYVVGFVSIMRVDPSPPRDARKTEHHDKKDKNRHALPLLTKYGINLPVKWGL